MALSIMDTLKMQHQSKMHYEYGMFLPNRDNKYVICQDNIT